MKDALEYNAQCLLLGTKWYLFIRIFIAISRPLGLQEVETPRFLDNRDLKIIKLSALRTGRLYPPGDTLVLLRVRSSVDPTAVMRPDGLSE